MQPPPLSLSLLGGFELRCGADTVPIRSGRVRSLLAWLALHPDVPQARQRVACALWPESDESQARTNLRNLLHQLRRAFPEIDRYLDTGGASLAWHPGAPVSVDVAEFEAAVDAARAAVGAGRAAAPGDAVSAALESALDLHAGPLLPDCYDRWLEPEQDRIRRLHTTGLETLLDRYLEAGEFGRAREVGDRILHHDRLNERAHRARIRSLAATGDRAGAARAFQQCAALLERELGVGPSAATVETYRAALAAAAASSPRPDEPDEPAEPAESAEPVESAESTEPAAASPPEGGIAAAPASVETVATDRSLPAEAPLVGRSSERATLRRVWVRTLESRSCTVWVTGEPGIGKTRLVQSFVEWVRRRGDEVVQARAYPTQAALAYGPVIEWLRSPPLAPTLAAVPPATRFELRRLLPELAPDAPPPETVPLTEAERRQRLHDAVITVLSTAGGPSTFVIDDLQWSDQETIDLLSTLVLRSPRPLLIVATVRTGETGPDHPVAEVEARLHAAGRLDRVELRPLSLEETGELARALLEPGLGEEDIRALHRETEGNPLFIVETARMGLPRGAMDDDVGAQRASPPRIRAVIEARLGLLSPNARLVTRIAATIGREFTLSLLLAASPLDEETTLNGLDEAWRRMLVRERGGGRYDFSHGKIREVAYRTTSPIRRRGYHQRLAEALETGLADGTAGPDATLDQIALHYDHGGCVAKAVEWYRRAAQAALDVSGLDAVRQLLGRALELVERLPGSPTRDETELDMRLELGSVLVALEGYGRHRTVENYERARELCARLDRPVTSPALRALALAALARGDLDAGSQLGRELHRAADRDVDDVARVEGAYVSGVMAFWKGDLRESVRRLEESIHAYRPDRRREHILLYAQDPKVVCLSRLGWALWLLGDVADATARRDEALALAERWNDPMSLAYALWFTLFIAVDQGDTARLADQAGRLQRLAAEHRLPYHDAVAEGLLGYLDTVHGDVRGGIARMRGVVTDERWLGMEYILKSQTLLLIARAAASAGDVETGRETVKAALEYLGSGPSVWKPALLQIDARLIGLGDRSGEWALPAFAAALDQARQQGAAWTELGVALDRARWVLEHRAGDPAAARADLERALVAYDQASSLPAVAAATIILEHLSPGGSP